MRSGQPWQGYMYAMSRAWGLNEHCVRGLGLETVGCDRCARVCQSGRWNLLLFETWCSWGQGLESGDLVVGAKFRLSDSRRISVPVANLQQEDNFKPLSCNTLHLTRLDSPHVWYEGWVEQRIETGPMMTPQRLYDISDPKIRAHTTMLCCVELLDNNKVGSTNQACYTFLSSWNPEAERKSQNNETEVSQLKYYYIFSILVPTTDLLVSAYFTSLIESWNQRSCIFPQSLSQVSPPK